MSTLKTNNVQVGQSVTATNNFTLYQPSTPDGTVRLGVGNTGATTADVASFNSSGVFAFNSGYGSSATAYGCRAWVNFNGTGTVAISASGNVSSITDNGTGDYTVNFATALADASYSTTITSSADSSNIRAIIATIGQTTSYTYQAPTTTTVRFDLRYGAGNDLYDCQNVNVAVFR